MERYIITSLIIGIVITGSIEHITIPLFSTMYSSTYFILLMTSLEGLIIFGSLFIITIIINKNYDNIYPNNIILLMLTGITNGLMSLCLLYSANPIRTPVIIQSIFLGLTIFPSIIFTKYILNKNVTYIWHITLPSLIFLLASIGCSIAPIIQNKNFNITHIAWVGVYLLGVVLLSLTNILQEKYTTITNDTFQNKLKLAFYGGIFQTIMVVCLFWVDLFFGYSDNAYDAWTNFTNSTLIFFTDMPKFGLVQLFVFDCLALFLLSIYLNKISTNYNMILTNLTNQSVAIFFSIFPNLNHGIKTSPVFVCISLFFNIISVVLWVKGENHN